MRGAVLGVFNSLIQARQAVEKIRRESPPNNYISVVVRSRTLYSGAHREEFAQELTLFPAEKILGIFDGYLVQSGPMELPGLGEILAGGPFAGELLQEKERGLSGNLASLGLLPPEHTSDFEQQVRDGSILVIVEADGEHANAIANHLHSFGGRQIEKWSRMSHLGTVLR